VNRVLAALALLGCSSPTPATNIDDRPDAGGTAIGLGPTDRPIVIVRGSSVTTRIYVTNPSHVPLDQPLTIVAGPLSEGVTATSASWNDDSATVSLTFTASSDASEGEIPIDIRAVANGKIVQSAPTVLAVSDPIGAIDMTYGDDGRVLFPGSWMPSAIRFLADGTLVMFGWDYSNVFVDRFTQDGTLLSTFGFGAIAQDLVTAMGDDGRVAFAINGNAGADVYEMDATGHTTNLAHFLRVTALSWDGDALFIAADNRLIHMAGTSLVDTPPPLDIVSLETIGSGIVLAGGVGNNKAATVTTYTFDGASLGVAESIVLGQGWFIRNTVTGAFGSFVGVQGSGMVGAFRVKDGAVTDSFSAGLQGQAEDIVVLPTETPLAFGSFFANALPATGIVQAFSLPFGVAGHTYVLGAGSDLAAAAVDPTGSFLYVTGNVSSTNGSSSYLARLRLTSTP